MKLKLTISEFIIIPLYVQRRPLAVTRECSAAEVFVGSMSSLPWALSSRNHSIVTEILVTIECRIPPESTPSSFELVEIGTTWTLIWFGESCTQTYTNVTGCCLRTGDWGHQLCMQSSRLNKHSLSSRNRSKLELYRTILVLLKLGNILISECFTKLLEK